MHHKYHTKSILLDAVPRGEADMFLTFYTRDLGLVRAQARGVRYLKSKLRFSLQPLMWPEISLIQGKGMWQVTSAQLDREQPDPLSEKAQKMFTRVARMVQRLIQGEERNEKLYSILHQSNMFLGCPECVDDDIELIEMLIVLRILYSLGYISDAKELQACVSTEDFTEAILGEVKENKDVALKEINRALKASQL